MDLESIPNQFQPIFYVFFFLNQSQLNRRYFTLEDPSKIIQTIILLSSIQDQDSRINLNWNSSADSVLKFNWLLKKYCHKAEVDKKILLKLEMIKKDNVWLLRLIHDLIHGLFPRQDF